MRRAGFALVLKRLERLGIMQWGSVMEEDRSYFQLRAEAELEAAEQARHPDAARAHFILAGLYLDRAYNSEPDASVIRTVIVGTESSAGKVRVAD